MDRPVNNRKALADVPKAIDAITWRLQEQRMCQRP